MSIAPALFVYRLFNDSTWKLVTEGSDDTSLYVYNAGACVRSSAFIRNISVYLRHYALGRNATDDFSVSCPYMKYMAEPKAGMLRSRQLKKAVSPRR